MDSDIVVVGRRIQNDVIVEFWLEQSQFGNSRLEPHPTLTPFPTEPPPKYETIPLNIDCGSPQSLAKAVADHIRTTVIDSWVNEFSMVVVGAGNNRYKIFQDTINTVGSPDKAVLVLGEGVPSAFPLVFHNYPSNLDDNYKALNRYPSSVDWATATRNVEVGNLLPSVQLAIADGDGNVRVYNYADKAIYVNMTREDRIAGRSLPVPITSSAGCVLL